MSFFIFIFLSIASYILFNYIRTKYILYNSSKYITENTIILITGGCLGIGKEIIKILLKKFKCRIINIDIRKEDFQELEKFDCENRLNNYYCDLSSLDQINKIIDEIINRYNKIDILINNAAIAFNKNFDDLSANMIIKTTEINLIAPMILCKKIIPLMNNNGHIVNIASVLSHSCSRKSSAYIMSKWGLFGFHESLRYDYYHSNLKFTIICPYGISTGMFPGFISTLPFLKVLEPGYVADCIINSIILNEKIVFIPSVFEYIIMIYKILPVNLRDFLYFKMLDKSTSELSFRQDNNKILKIE